MTTLTEFLLQRIAEDKAAAQAVVDSHAMWDWESYVAQAGMYEEPASEFAQRMNPARVLAECEAKRRIVELHMPDHECTDGSGNYPGVFAGDPALHMTVCDTLRTLASVYADHADYRQEWAL